MTLKMTHVNNVIEEHHPSNYWIAVNRNCMLKQ